MSFLKVNHILESSSVQGPGKRFTIWVQGCSLHCHGCQNIDTWDFDLGTSILVQDLVERVKTAKVDGLTITGGEPLDQFKPTFELAQKNFKLTSVFLCTGYNFKQIIGHNIFYEILNYVDIVCSGPFDESKICRSQWKGSSNQEVKYLTERGKELLKLPVYKTEYRIDKTTGNTLVTGFTLK
jgi:anaerobic ribonucleoside-triphosphate reductase activating protein